MRIDAISTTFVRMLGPELGASVAAQFTDPAASGKSLQSFLGTAGAALPFAAAQQRSAAPPGRLPFGAFPAGPLTARPLAAFSNPMQGVNTEMRRLTESLNQFQRSLTPAATSFAGGTGRTDAMVSGAGRNIDSMMGSAEKLLASDKQSDQIQGQLLMQRAMRLFEMISKMLEQQSQLAQKAIQAIR